MVPIQGIKRSIRNSFDVIPLRISQQFSGSTLYLYITLRRFNFEKVIRNTDSKLFRNCLVHSIYTLTIHFYGGIDCSNVLSWRYIFVRTGIKRCGVQAAQPKYVIFELNRHGTLMYWITVTVIWNLKQTHISSTTHRERDKGTGRGIHMNINCRFEPIGSVCVSLTWKLWSHECEHETSHYLCLVWVRRRSQPIYAHRTTHIHKYTWCDYERCNTVWLYSAIVIFRMCLPSESTNTYVFQNYLIKVSTGLATLMHFR